MNILVWNCPWGSQGDSFFFKNCLKETLVPQANLLAGKENNVYVAYIDYLEEAVLSLKDQVNKLKINYDELTSITGFGRVLEKIYADPSGELVEKLVVFFKNILPKDIDVIITWENPIPYLEKIYPDALIINQMPGSFSRSPYPNTITFDPVGLYNQSILANADNVFNVDLSNDEIKLGKNFIKYVKKNISEIQPYSREDIARGAEKLILLPLQVSAHYAFYADSHFSSQIGILEETLNNSVNKDACYLVTQYKSSFTADKPIDSKTYGEYVNRWPNLIWHEKYDALPFQSQLLLPSVDEICAYTSSIIFQAMAWGKPISILNGSYYKKYETKDIYDIERNKKVVSFLINRYQPLASYVTKNASFLNSLLKKMLYRKQQGMKGIDLCIPFNEIDSKYSSDVLSEFTNNVLLKDVARINPQVNNQYQFLEKFRRLAERNTISHISFDVFDTLLERPVENPSGLFHIIAHEVWRSYKIL